MAESPKKIVVLGGCGFLSSHLLPALRKMVPGVELVAADKCESVPADRECPGTEYLLGCDLANALALRDCVDGADLVINTVGLVSFSRKAAGALFKVNAELAVAVAHACLETGVPWLVHVSSVAALGFDSSGGEVTESFEFDWDLARRRSKVYMLSKREGDLLLRAVGEGLALTTVYPGLLIGPGDPATTPKLMAAARAPIALVPPGGTNVVDVRDVAEGLAALAADGPRPGAFILGGDNVTYEDLARRGRQALGITGPVAALPRFLKYPAVAVSTLVEALAPKPIPVTTDNVDSSFERRYFSSKLAADSFGYAPSRSIEDSFRDYEADSGGAGRRSCS